MFPKFKDLTRVIGWTVNTIAALLALAVPVVYLLTHLQYQRGEIESEARLNAQLAAEVLSLYPQPGADRDGRLRRLVDEDVVYEKFNRGHEQRSMVDPSGLPLVAVEAGEAPAMLAAPTIAARADVVGGNGRVFGAYRVERSIRHILFEALGLAILTSTLAGLAVVAVHRIAIQRLRQAQATIHTRARRDDLTGLPNRAAAIAEIDQLMARARRRGWQVAVLLVDLDRFKLVNDGLGHQAGNQVLKTVAARLTAAVRSTDLVARIAGDEFLVVLDGIADRDVVERIGQSLVGTFDMPIPLANTEAVLGASVGAAMFPDDAEDAESLIQMANTALHQSRITEPGKLRFFAPAMKAVLDERLQLQQALRQAITRNEFFLVFQPIVDFRDMRTVGAEALIRWNRPGHGVVPPGVFIPALEDSGLIIQVGEWVLAESCRRIRQWRATLAPDLFVSVNVSARQFRESSIAQSVARVIREADVPPEAVELELTESMLFENDQASQAKVGELKAIGVRIALDDFGTGYSSLSRLKTLPFDIVKIDRSFVIDVASDRRDASIVGTIVALARGLDLQVTAEGVETGEQLDALRESGCDLGQGYLFAKPLSVEDFEKRMQGAMTTPAAAAGPTQVTPKSEVLAV